MDLPSLSLEPSRFMALTMQRWTEEAKPFPASFYVSSCLIWYKRSSGYGVFLLVDKFGNKYVVKVRTLDIEHEAAMSLYINKFAPRIPHLMHVEAIYEDKAPQLLKTLLFRNPVNEKLILSNVTDPNDTRCKYQAVKLEDIFQVEDHQYMYYVMPACNYDLRKFLIAVKQLTFEQFVGYSFQLLVGLLTLQTLSILHGDLKPENIIVCDSKIHKAGYSAISYNYHDQYTWKFDYSNLDGKDLRIIDYGESRIMSEELPACEVFKNDITAMRRFIIERMWTFVTNKQEEPYSNLLANLKTCNSLISVLVNSIIFEPYSSAARNSFVVDLL